MYSSAMIVAAKIAGLSLVTWLLIIVVVIAIVAVVSRRRV